jgi:hypothetical protein
MDRNVHSPYFDRGFRLVPVSGGGHEVHADFIADADDGVFRDFAGFEFEDDFVG